MYESLLGAVWKSFTYMLETQPQHQVPTVPWYSDDRVTHLICVLGRPSARSPLYQCIAEESDHHDKQEIAGVHQVKVDHRAVVLKQTKVHQPYSSPSVSSVIFITWSCLSWLKDPLGSLVYSFSQLCNQYSSILLDNLKNSRDWISRVSWSWEIWWQIELAFFSIIYTATVAIGEVLWWLKRSQIYRLFMS